MHSENNTQNTVSDEVEQLIQVIEEIAKGQYSNKIHQFAKEQYPEAIYRLAEAIGMMMVKIEAREYKISMDNQELKKLNEQYKKATISTVIAMSSALGARDTYTEGHDQRTAGYALRIARRIGLDKEEAQCVYLAALLHDIGKLGFNDRLFSADCVNDDELMQSIRDHPEIGYNILQWLEFLGPAREYILYHHERIDGSGYPQGLSGDEIPLGARILAVADTFDAITTDRPYQKGRTLEQGLDILKAISGSHLDSNLVEVFCEEIRENGLE